MHKLHVLVVEDREIIAAKIQRALVGAGYHVIGLAPTLASAATQLEFAERVDAAVLDIDLRGEPVFPVAERLQALRVPFIFLTGYGASAVDARWREVHRVEKPFETASLLCALDEAIRRVPPPIGPGASVGNSVRARLAMEMIRDTRDAITEARAARERPGGDGQEPPR